MVESLKDNILAIIKSNKLPFTDTSQSELVYKWIESQEINDIKDYNKIRGQIIKDYGIDIGKFVDAQSFISKKKVEQFNLEQTKDEKIIKELFNDRETKKESIQMLANYFLEKYKFKTVFGTKSNEIYIYNNGVYLKKGNEIIQTDTERILKESTTTYYTKEIVNKIARLTAIDRESLNNVDNNLICLNNGVLNIQTMEFKKHNPKQLFLNKIPINYDPKTKCPTIIKFFEEVLYDGHIKVIQEWLGYLLYRQYFIKKAIILIGEPDTGKTTFLTLVNKFIGEKNTAAISLQLLSINKFARGKLFSKHLNAFDDLGYEDIENLGAFKMATGGGYLDGEYKFGDNFQFINYAKLMFAANKIPKTKDVDDEAYYNRWIIIPFDNVFDVKNKNTDPFLMNKLTAEKELSGLLNFALIGLKRILKNGRIDYDKTPKEIQTIMQRSGNPLVAFVQDCFTRDDGEWISKQGLFEGYTKYITEKRLPRMTKEQFGRNIQKYCAYILDSKQGKLTGWRNIKVLVPS